MLRAFLLLSLFIPNYGYAATVMPTGVEGGTYHAIGNDISTISAKYGVDIEVKSSVGSIENIRQLLKNDEVDLSITQSDVIDALRSSNKSATQSAFQNLRLVLPLYQEEVHLLANKSVTSISDLAGKRVSIGQIGSGTHVTATSILNKLNIKTLANNKLGPVDAYKSLLFGKLDAVFFVSGKPISHIQGMLEMNTRKDLKPFVDAIHLIAIDDSRLMDSYAATTIEAGDYVSKNGQYALTDVAVATVAVTATLVTRTLPNNKTAKTKSRCRQIGKIHNAIRKELPSLAAGGTTKKPFHPKWATVNLDANIELEKSPCLKLKPVKRKTIKNNVSNERVAPKPDKVAVPLTASELAEANCLLLTGKACVQQAPLPKEEALLPETTPEMPNTIEQLEPINGLTLEPSL